MQPKFRCVSCYADSGSSRDPLLLYCNAAVLLHSVLHSMQRDTGVCDYLALTHVEQSLGLIRPSFLLQIPDSATPHDVAATVLGFFASLPAPFMPPAVAQVCNVCVPTQSAAASLLADSLSPVEWAVFRHVSGMICA